MVLKKCKKNINEAIRVSLLSYTSFMDHPIPPHTLPYLGSYGGAQAPWIWAVFVNESGDVTSAILLPLLQQAQTRVNV